LGWKYLLERLGTDSIICSEYLIGSDKVLREWTYNTGSDLFRITGDDTLRFGDLKLLIQSHGYPPQRGTSIPADRTSLKIHVEKGPSHSSY
jgi:hypothetical protein